MSRLMFCDPLVFRPIRGTGNLNSRFHAVARGVVFGWNQRWRMLVRDHVHGNDGEDTSRYEGCQHNEEGGQVCADSGEGLQRGLAKLSVGAPTTDRCSAADDEGGKR